MVLVGNNDDVKKTRADKKFIRFVRDRQTEKKMSFCL